MVFIHLQSDSTTLVTSECIIRKNYGESPPLFSEIFTRGKLHVILYLLLYWDFSDNIWFTTETNWNYYGRTWQRYFFTAQNLDI